MAFHIDDLGVAARYYGRKEWKFGLISTKPVSVDMGFKMVRRIEWNIINYSNSACGKGAN